MHGQVTFTYKKGTLFKPPSGPLSKLLKGRFVGGSIMGYTGGFEGDATSLDCGWGHDGSPVVTAEVPISEGLQTSAGAVSIAFRPRRHGGQLLIENES